MQRRTGLDVPGDGVGQRLEKRCGLAYPIRQGRAIELDAGTGSYARIWWMRAEAAYPR